MCVFQVLCSCRTDWFEATTQSKQVRARKFYLQIKQIEWLCNWKLRQGLPTPYIYIYGQRARFDCYNTIRHFRITFISLSARIKWSLGRLIQHDLRWCSNVLCSLLLLWFHNAARTSHTNRPSLIHDVVELPWCAGTELETWELIGISWAPSNGCFRGAPDLTRTHTFLCIFWITIP